MRLPGQRSSSVLLIMLVSLDSLVLRPGHPMPRNPVEVLEPHDLIVVGLSGTIRVVLPPTIAADTIRWTLADEERHFVATHSLSWVRSDEGDTVQLIVTAPRYGLFLLTLRHSADEYQHRSTVAFVPETGPDPRLGLHLYSLRWVPPIGVGSVRLWDTHTLWAEIEPSRGTFHWDRLDTLINDGNTHGLRILLTLGMTPRWASSEPDEPSPYGPSFPGASAPPRSTADWKALVQGVLRRYAGRLESIEFWNEPNYAFLIGRAHADATLLAAGTASARNSGVKVTTVGPALVGAFVPFFDSVAAFTGADHPEVFSMHSYASGPIGPEALLPQLHQARAVLAQHRWQSAIWITEVGYWVAPRVDGWPATPNQIDSATPRAMAPNWRATWPYRPAAEDSIAALLVRQYAMYLGNGVEKVYWYAWTNGMFGLTDTAGAPRAAVVAYAALSARIAGLNEAIPVMEGPSVYAYRFSDGRHATIVAWSIAPGGTRWTPTPDDTYSTYDIWGNVTAPAVQPGTSILLNATPLYLQTPTP